MRTKTTSRCMSMLCAATVMMAAGTSKNWAGAPATGKPSQQCWYGVDRICAPKRTSYGYYAARWRRWPADVLAEARLPGKTEMEPGEIPSSEIPDKTEEAEISTKLPGQPAAAEDQGGERPQEIPLEPIQKGSSEPPSQLEKDRREDPFRDDPLPPELDVIPPGLGHYDRYDPSTLPRLGPSRTLAMPIPGAVRDRLASRPFSQRTGATRPTEAGIQRLSAVAPVLTESVPGRVSPGSSNPLRAIGDAFQPPALSAAPPLSASPSGRSSYVAPRPSSGSNPLRP